jgi:hypothetical protein
MQQNIVIQGYTLTATPNPSTVKVAMKPTDITALKCTAASKSVLINKLSVDCSLSGAVTGGNISGTGTATITASTSRVTCEGQSILAANDSSTISIIGSVSSSPPTSQTVPVTVTITDAGQQNATVNKA